MASSVSLLALPISVFLIIFSLYPDLVTVKNFNVYELKSYYEICDKSITNFTDVENYAIQDTILKEDSTVQIVIIDRTASVKTKTENIKNFGSSLKSFLAKPTTIYFDTTKIKSLNYLNDLIYLSCVKSLYNSKVLSKGGECSFYLYNGSNDNGEAIKGEIDDLLDTICNINTYINSKKLYYTNIKTIIDTVIPPLINNKSKFNLTFISDFYHDDSLNYNSIVNCDLKKLRDAIGNNSMNLIIIDHNKVKKDKYIIQNEFLQKYRNHFEGTSNDRLNHFLYIDLEHYTDEDYCDCDADLLEFEELFKINKNKLDKIIFETPITNQNNYEVATAKVRFSKNKKDTTFIGYRWKFISNFDDNYTKIKYSTNKSHGRYFYRTRYEDKVDSTEILELEIKTKPDELCNYDDLKFCISYKDSNGNHFEEFDIEVKKTHFSDGYKSNLIKILDFFCILMLIVLVSGGILFIHNYPQSAGKIGIVLLTILLLLLCCFFWKTWVLFPKHWLPILTLIIILLLTVGKILILISTKQKIIKLLNRVKDIRIRQKRKLRILFKRTIKNKLLKIYK